MSETELDAYFQRIGYFGPRSADLTTLRSIHWRHALTIPSRISARSCSFPSRSTLQAKLVHGGRGGYCFEQNLLLRSVLETLGFAVTALAARVRWNVPDGLRPLAVICCCGSRLMAAAISPMSDSAVSRSQRR